MKQTSRRLGRPESVLDDAVRPAGAAWEYDAANRRARTTLGNGVASLFAYDLNNRLTRIQHASEWSDPLDPGNLLVDLEYGYDALGNRLWRSSMMRWAGGSARATTAATRTRVMRRLRWFARGTFWPA